VSRIFVLPLTSACELCRWEYVQRHNVQLPDEYDQIHRDIEPFWGIRPADLGTLQAEHEAEMGTYTLGNGWGFGPIKVVNTSLTPDAVGVADQRSDDQLDILEPVKQWIPPFRATFTVSTPKSLYPYEHLMPYSATMLLFCLLGMTYGRKRSMQQQFENVSLISLSFAPFTYSMSDIDINRRWDDRHLGWGSACSTNAPLRQNVNFSKPPSIPALHALRPKTLIHNHLAAMDPCLHPTHTHLMGQFTNYGKGPPPRQRLHPSFTMSSTRIHSDILVVAPEMWTDNVGDDPAWEDKKHETLLWRGTTTGTRMEESMPYWRLSQRLRMVNMTNQQMGTYDVLSSLGYDRPVGEPLTVEAATLNEDLMDIGFSGKPKQCSPGVCATIAGDYKFRETQTRGEANIHKYILDVSSCPLN
jgi:hypothetical protein